MTGASGVPGTVTVEQRALVQVVRAATREILGTPTANTSVHLGTAAGGLSLRVATQVPIVPGSALMPRLHQARARLAERVSELTDRAVTSVDLRVEGALRTDSERRVR